MSERAVADLAAVDVDLLAALDLPPTKRRQAVKVGYAQGAYIRFGGDYRIVSAAWQYSWVSGPPAR